MSEPKAGRGAGVLNSTPAMTDSKELAGRVAVVAGASRGIGRAIALELAREGADLVAIARDGAKLESLRNEIEALGRRFEAIAIDVTDDATLLPALDAAAKKLGPPTLLVHAVASIYAHQRLQFVETSDMDRMHATDVRSAVVLARWALGHMVTERFGRIVLLGSLAARMGIRGGALYATSKAALEGLARGIAIDYSQRGVTANVIALGFVETERFADRLAHDEVARQRLVEGTATKRIITPDEVAKVTSFLCSERARSITGSVLEMTGGSHLAVAL